MFVTMILVSALVLSVIISKTSASKALVSSLITTLCYLGVFAFVTVTVINAFRNQTSRT